MVNDKLLRDTLKTAGFEHLYDQVKALLRPAVFIKGKALSKRPFMLNGKKGDDSVGAKAFDKALEKLPIAASRFGGVPDMPEGVDWPTRDDVPMEFVAQINLEDIAEHDAENILPHNGSLLFFYNSQWLTYDQDDDYSCCSVIWHQGDNKELVRTPPPSISWQGEYDEGPRPAPFVHGVATLSFSRFEMLPGGVSPFTPPKTELGEIWQDFTCSYSNVLYPATESYTANHLLGYVDAQDYVDAHKHGKEDRCLLQIDSDDSAQFQWGDCDRLYFMLTKKQLAARNFSKTRLYSLLG